MAICLKLDLHPQLSNLVGLVEGHTKFVKLLDFLDVELEDRRDSFEARIVHAFRLVETKARSLAACEDLDGA